MSLRMVMCVVRSEKVRVVSYVNRQNWSDGTHTLAASYREVVSHREGEDNGDGKRGQWDVDQEDVFGSATAHWVAIRIPATGLVPHHVASKASSLQPVPDVTTSIRC